MTFNSVQVEITKVPAVTDLPTIAGTMQPRTPGLFTLLFNNANRFPATGGHEVEPGEAYQISVSGKNETGATVTAMATPSPIALAPGAIVDLTVDL
jgi:hypothetical protein